MPNLDQLPRVFQANLARLFDRVILPGLDALRLHATLKHGEAATMDQFLDRAVEQVDNYTVNEAAKAYALTLAGVFERQLSIWARATHPAEFADKSNRRGFHQYLAACAEQAGVDIEQGDLGTDLIQMFVVANVVRHGEGEFCLRLRVLAPALWDDELSDYQDLLTGGPIPSEYLRLRKNDLIRYIRATTRFWGLADPLPMSVTDPPYQFE